MRSKQKEKRPPASRWLALLGSGIGPLYIGTSGARGSHDAHRVQNMAK
jgi:hypothetical protein